MVGWRWRFYLLSSSWLQIGFSGYFPFCQLCAEGMRPQCFARWRRRRRHTLRMAATANMMLVNFIFRLKRDWEMWWEESAEKVACFVWKSWIALAGNYFHSFNYSWRALNKKQKYKSSDQKGCAPPPCRRRKRITVFTSIVSVNSIRVDSI